MKQRLKRALMSIPISILVTTLGFLVAFVTGGDFIGRLFYWQGYLLQDLVAAPNLGTTDHPHYEATPVHLIAFIFGIPFGILVYSSLSYVVLSLVQKSQEKRDKK